MTPLILHDAHESIGAHFQRMQGAEVVAHYGDPLAEYSALGGTAALADLSSRGRLGTTGADRQRFLNGQVTNNVKDLEPGKGCYAAVVNAKGRLQGDLNIYCLPEELLLDCEPGQGPKLAARLEQFVIADDVQVVDISAEYGLLSVQGPQCAAVLARAYPDSPLPNRPWASELWSGQGGEICVVNLPRARRPGLDLFVPQSLLGQAWTQLAEAVRALNGRPCGWDCLEWARIEAGLPRYGQDMDDRNLAPEAGIETRAISYTKGCYIGQEIISRIRSMGHVTRRLQGFELQNSAAPLPCSGDPITHQGHAVGYITSAIHSPALGHPVALGYLRSEVKKTGTELQVQTQAGPRMARLRALPFVGEE